MKKQLERLYNNSLKIDITNNDKIVIMSDQHRGAGDNYDNFLKNRNIYNAALSYYLNNDFTYIELGDGDDLWEVEDCKDIVEEHLDSFKLLKEFHDKNRLIMLYGNHDLIKKYPRILKECFYKYYNKETEIYENLLNNLRVYESLILNYEGEELLLFHGHQLDIINSSFWHLSRFLVRFVWKKLEHIGLKDPTNAAKNYPITRYREKKLSKWSMDNNIILISGHTHKPMFPKKELGLYFNDGSCIHPNGITCLEIENGYISLVKWKYVFDDENTIRIEKINIDKKEKIENFFKH